MKVQTSLFLVLALLPVLGVAEDPASAVPPEKMADLIRLMKVTIPEEKVEELIEKKVETAIREILAHYPDSPPDRLEAIREEYRAALRDDLIGSGLAFKFVALAFDRQFNHEEVRELLGFFESSVGRKWISAAPAIEQDSFEAGRDYSEEGAARIRERVARRLRERGFPVSEPAKQP